MTAEEFSQFKHDSVHELMRLNESCARIFKISSWPRYDYDLDRGTLTFSQEGTPRVVASVLVAGTTSVSGGTWLWSWANAHIPINVSEPLKKVRDFGISEDISELKEAYAPDDEHVGWEMAALASKIMGAKGAYRCPGENGFVYLILTDIAFAEVATPSDTKRRIACGTHGEAYETFVCEHLVAHPEQRWFSQEPDSENPWPDAWCAVCNAFFEAQGEWNQKNQAHLKIELLCHLCYQQFRAKSEHDR
jgi:uncharacterized protein DUF6882